MFFVNTFMAFPAKAEESLGPLCCDSLSITTAMTDSCCLSVTLNNPYCYDPLIQFLQWNSSSNSYEVVYQVNNAGTSTTFVYCPMNDDDFIKFRVQVFQDENSPLPHCNLGNDQFVEGWTQFSDSINVSYCCGCPTNVNSWLTLVIEKDEDNCPGGCKVTPVLNIPDSITCYRYYSVAIGNGDFSAIKPLSQLSAEWVCIDYNETVEYFIALLHRDDIDVDEEYYNLCRLEKVSEPCDSCPCPPNVINWLHVVVEKDEAECPDGCQVAMKLNIPQDYSCYQYYQLVHPDNMMMNLKHITNDPIEDQTFCMDENTTGNIRVALMKEPAPNWFEACIILYPVTCDSSISDPDSIVSTCYDECIEEWEVQTPHVFNYYGCTVTVEYETRRGCPPENFQDIHILKISREYNCLFGITLKELFSIAFRRLVQDNPMGFLPLTPTSGVDCYDTWRLFDSQCKDNIFSIGQNGEIIYSQVNCPGDMCCVQRFEVCRDEFGNATITPYGMYRSSSMLDCILVPPAVQYLPPSLATLSQAPTFPMNTCIFDCDSTKIDFDTVHAAHQKIRLNNEEDSQYNYYSDGNTFYFNCNDSYPCNYMIEIYELIGRRIFVYDGTTSSAENKIDIRNHVIERGVYLFKVTVNGTIIGTGKIIK